MTSVQPACIQSGVDCLLIGANEDTWRLAELLAEEHLFVCRQVIASQLETKLATLPDVIFLHACQPGDYPILLLQQLCQKHPGIPVIAFDLNFSRFRNQSFLSAGATEYLVTSDLTTDRLKRVIRYSVKATPQQQAYPSEQFHSAPQSDLLTGLQNRHHFYTQLCDTLSQTTKSIALINIDLDGFSRFNHLNGSQAGDRIVQILARRIANLFDCDIARMGADEFSLFYLLEAEQDTEAALKPICEALLASLSEPYQLNDGEFTLPCSAGISISRQHQDADSIIFQAHQARLQAKQRSECSYNFFASSLPDAEAGQNDLEPDLIVALQKEQFELFYQPRVDIRTGTIIGAEALIRWRHPERGLIAPGEFIDLAERTGLIVPIGYWVIYRAGMDMQTINRAKLNIGRIGVNLSFRQFEDRYLSRTIQRLIEKYQIDTSILEFELTESALFSNEAHIRQGIEELNQLGITFSLDDFGTGYSSFTLLQKLPVNSLKIDRSFTQGVIEQQDDREIVKAIINLARSLNIEVIAEGVETRAQHDFLIEHDCYQAQGFLYSRPMPFQDFFNMLQNSQQTPQKHTQTN
ncbi:putative bifunctional diguanylate cyclase/phosphodiesterase [Aliamphritea ceti]|uniref:putative bifunctional diguanylate cyclase/phosphodiesterase n=1 Tax=Aliamphritea ceti TaxID=1524258 RepID=UPI0021C2D8E8|nr:bifunctional diguanylate cyclase/phosphodiesterase [Aliamphritea ceti]